MSAILLASVVVVKCWWNMFIGNIINSLSKMMKLVLRTDSVKFKV